MIIDVIVFIKVPRTSYQSGASTRVQKQRMQLHDTTHVFCNTAQSQARQIMAKKIQHGRQQETMGNNERPLEAEGSHERLREATGIHERPRQATGDNKKLRQATRDNGRPRETTGDNKRQHKTTENHGWLT